jgi:hypothetical protein
MNAEIIESLKLNLIRKPLEYDFQLNTNNKCISLIRNQTYYFIIP